MEFCKVPFDINFKTKFKVFIQHLVLDIDCCISRNDGRTEINDLKPSKAKADTI